MRRGAGEGELQRTKDGSQRFGAGVQAAVENFLAARGTSRKVGDLGSFLVDVLMILERISVADHGPRQEESQSFLHLSRDIL